MRLHFLFENVGTECLSALAMDPSQVTVTWNKVKLCYWQSTLFWNTHKTKEVKLALQQGVILYQLPLSAKGPFIHLNSPFAAYLLFFGVPSNCPPSLAAGSNSFCSLYMLKVLGAPLACTKEYMNIKG